jgi:hypothetical protein
MPKCSGHLPSNLDLQISNIDIDKESEGEKHAMDV